MGKRSNFARIERDCYDTPPEAVAPLIPHLPDRQAHVWEPCAGNGALVDHLEAAGVGVFAKSDIAPRRDDVLKVDALQASGPMFIRELGGKVITNPPWTRSVLHPMIEHFGDICPTWLLFDADWMHTKQSAPYMPRLRKVVSVGRVKWIKDSPHTGKDNVCWYLFDRPSDQPAQFFGRCE